MWSQQPLVKFRCPVKALEGIFITSLCIKGLYFMRNLCFLGVTITFGFILGHFLFVFAQLLRTRTPFLFPQTSRIVAYVAAFLVSMMKFLHRGVDKETLQAFQVFTPLSQLIFSLAGILMRSGLSCNTCAWQEFPRLRPAVAWPLRSTLVK